MSFKELTVHPALFKTLTDMGVEHPTEVQLQALPLALSGEDVLARAETGSGKTLAYAIPVIHHFMAATAQAEKRGKAPMAVILLPSRELVIQVREVMQALGANLQRPPRLLSVFGGVSLEPQIEACEKGCDVIVTTPSRLRKLKQKAAVNFSQVRCVVVDEFDKLIKDQFISDLEAIVESMPEKSQRLFFSATQPSRLRKVVRQFMHKPSIVNVDAQLRKHELKIEHTAFEVPSNNDKLTALLKLLEKGEPRPCLIFCNAKKQCDKIYNQLQKAGIDCVSAHGNMPQYVRAQAVKSFKQGDSAILVATDVVARGIDVPELPLVINYDLPRLVEDYQHRVGRTARGGRGGQAWSIYDAAQAKHLRLIMRHMEKQFSVKRVNL